MILHYFILLFPVNLYAVVGGLRAQSWDWGILLF